MCGLMDQRVSLSYCFFRIHSCILPDDMAITLHASIHYVSLESLTCVCYSQNNMVIIVFGV